MAKIRYPLHQSPLYKVLGMGQLERVLSIEIQSLRRLLAPRNYRVWLNEKGREIQQPLHWLAKVHNRIAHLLSKIELPDFLYSQKGRSYIDNATQHCNPHPLGKTDITGFYTNTTHAMVRRMFTELFKCAGDVATVLADICCYNQKHLPTGSTLSGRVAFFAALPMFNAVEDLTRATGSRMTVYVDDITVSGPRVTKKLMSEVCQVIRRHGLRTKKAKTKTFAPKSVKPVTGVVVSQWGIRLPNFRHKRIWEVRQALREAPTNERKSLLRSLRGRLQEARQITNASNINSSS